MSEPLICAKCRMEDHNHCEHHTCECTHTRTTPRPPKARVVKATMRQAWRIARVLSDRLDQRTRRFLLGPNYSWSSEELNAWLFQKETK